jgi:hypothetical protein
MLLIARRRMIGSDGDGGGALGEGRGGRRGQKGREGGTGGGKPEGSSLRWDTVERVLDD